MWMRYSSRASRPSHTSDPSSRVVGAARVTRKKKKSPSRQVRSSSVLGLASSLWADGPVSSFGCDHSSQQLKWSRPFVLHVQGFCFLRASGMDFMQKSVLELRTKRCTILSVVALPRFSQRIKKCIANTLSQWAGSRAHKRITTFTMCTR